MAKVNRSGQSYQINVTSQHPYQGGMTAWALRDFVKALDEQGIPEDTRIVCDYDQTTRHLIGLRVSHTVVVATGTETETAEVDV